MVIRKNIEFEKRKELARDIRNAMFEKNINLLDLSNKSGVAISTCSILINPFSKWASHCPTVKTLTKIFNVLDIRKDVKSYYA